MDSMDDTYLNQLADRLAEQGIDLAPGLSVAEVEAVESTWAFRFPPDLRKLLTFMLPVSSRFPDWRRPDSDAIRDQLTWPADGLCFDIEHNDFWIDAWGKKPQALEAACAIARRAVAEAPPLIPIYGHRYLPADPPVEGNPVFSVYQTDIIYYGFDLPSYLAAEFGVPNPYPLPESTREVRFWSELERLNC